jgi:hypothetical protein
MSTLSPRFGSHLRLSFLGRLGPACVFRMSHVRTFFLLLWRDLCWPSPAGTELHRIVSSNPSAEKIKVYGHRLVLLEILYH